MTANNLLVGGVVVGVLWGLHWVGSSIFISRRNAFNAKWKRIMEERQV